jgi:hypothetical protein
VLGRRRAAALAAVLILHLVLFALLTASLRNRAPAPAPSFVSSLILLPHTPRTLKPDRRAVGFTPMPPPLPAPREFKPPPNPAASVDWYSEAKRAAQTVTAEPPFRGFGSHAAGSAEPPDSSGSSHVAGDQEHLDAGTWIVWVGPNCYILSELPTLGMWDITAGSMPARTVCRQDSSSANELFRSLPAYDRFHAR